MHRDPASGEGDPGRDLLDSALRLLRSDLPRASTVRVVKSLAGGYSDARVVLCDIGSVPGRDADGALNGQYILKAGFSTRRPQAAAHGAFTEPLGEFGRTRVPRLAYSLQDSGTSLDVYDIAGFSLDRVRSADHVDAEDREEVCARASRQLLRAQLDAAGPPGYQGSVGTVLREWLGEDFPGNQRGARVREAAAQLDGGGRVFRYEGELLPNPLVLFDPALGIADAPLPCFRGPTHGDLHLRNLLVRGSLPTRDLAYWLIDVSWDAPAPLLYDHAYLELSALLFGLGTSTSGRVLPVLARLDDESLTVPVELDLNDVGLVTLLRRIRGEAAAVLEEREAKRVDVWRRQLLIARIAAGLNWAAKPLDDLALRRAALISAGWAARLLLRESHPAQWVELARGERLSTVGLATGASATPVTAEEALRRWRPFHQAGGAMDLFLVADAVAGKPELAALAHCGWSAVIDLDPDSDESGLAGVVRPELAERRHVSMFGANRPQVPPAGATSWLMAAGWHSRDEPAAESDADWRRGGHLQRVRRLVDDTHEGTPHQAAAVLCLRSGRRDREIDRVAEYIDERYGGIAVRLDLAQAPAVGGIDLDAFFSVVAESLPPADRSAMPSLPALDGGRWHLSWSDLHRLSVDLEVLHSEILSDSQSSAQPRDGFWRGRPPTWQELEARVDVARSAYPSLLEEIEQRLGDHQLATVRLNHSPGAGGTTLARRVAWDLHRAYPTVLLRTYSETTADRIDEIYQETGRPALVVAESAVLPEYDCDELTHSLAQRNTRAVLLWVNRTNVARDRRQGTHQVVDPLRSPERERFLDEFRRRATTDRARQRLDDFAAGTANVVAAQELSPFFFGLCVYEERFEGIASYVRNHLAELSPRQKELARHLALITRYGQEAGLPVDMVESWMGRERPRFAELSEADLHDLLGPDLRHLVVARGRTLRLLHPLIAEEVLKGEADGARYSLGQISVDFIRKTTEYLGPDNSTTAFLLNELFIRRTSWSPEKRKADNFSELVESMPEEAGARVFEQLTEQCPNNAHFWNHRGRYDIYKVRADFGRAEGYVLKAVEKSKGRDATHLHTLGMVRRFWIENELKELARDGGKHTPEELLASVEPLFDRAMEAFADAARHQRNTDYTWSTPIQLIAHVVERLWRASGEGSFADFVAGNAPSALWATEQLARAEELLDNLRNTNAEGKYYHLLNNQLTELYGDIERLVEQWQELRRRGRQHPEVDLAIARTLYAQSGRDWSRISEEQARTIAEMVEGSVTSGRATDADLRLWFQSYRRLPEYSETNAMERLGWFASEKNSLDANYYLYILHFLIWLRGDARDQERIRYYLEECKRLGRQHRRQWSFEWLGKESRPHPLVHFSELGRQRFGPTSFWSHPQPLARVRGVIEEIHGPQSGRLRITNGRLPAFFTPRNRFRETRDVNAAVEFYLGFSYEGLRAWEPTYPGEVPEALAQAEPLRPPAPAAPTPALSLGRASAPEPPGPPGPRAAAPAAPEPAAAAPEPAAPAAPTPTPAATPAPAARVSPPTTPAAAEPPSPVIPVTPPPQVTPPPPVMSPPPPAARPHRPDPAVLRSLAPRHKGQGTPEDFQRAILDLLQRARAGGRPLTSLELGDALQTLFGPESYRRFRRECGRGKLRRAVESVGFRTVPTPQGFDVDLL
ncbi:hypothetical protein [Streptomyces hoynatensis]|uniref:Novel STAND NTPase 5 domain-containing protein n=1 Tax=Streptomyces hoynatensis TaxID=1141874 RepID=A0A3A9Z3J8_9ACTN|nr:hypothetical protein [Streptomyces hoynatensis]RKN43021.1 hypothetical protein D7294_10930 [Streptomyces hoynatensis]